MTYLFASGTALKVIPLYLAAATLPSPIDTPELVTVSEFSTVSVDSLACSSFATSMPASVIVPLKLSSADFKTISAMCGYKNYSSFFRSFTDFFGITPTQKYEQIKSIVENESKK